MPLSVGKIKNCYARQDRSGDLLYVVEVSITLLGTDLPKTYEREMCFSERSSDELTRLQNFLRDIDPEFDITTVTKTLKEVLDKDWEKVPAESQKYLSKFIDKPIALLILEK